MQHYLYKDCLQVLAEFTGDHGWYERPSNEIISIVNKKLIISRNSDKIIFYTGLKDFILNLSNDLVLVNHFNKSKDELCDYICKCGYLTLFKIIHKTIYWKYGYTSNGDFKRMCNISTPEIIKYFIDECIDSGHIFFSDKRIIHQICVFSTPEMLKYVISKGVDLEHAADWNWRPIHALCYYSTPEMIKYIISKEVNLTSAITKFNNVNVDYDINKLISLNDRISPADKESLYKHIALKKLNL